MFFQLCQYFTQSGGGFHIKELFECKKYQFKCEKLGNPYSTYLSESDIASEFQTVITTNTTAVPRSISHIRTCCFQSTDLLATGGIFVSYLCLQEMTNIKLFEY